MANKKGNPQNLKPFVKGEDPRRNVTGENRKLPDIEVIFANGLGEEKDGRTAAEKIVASQISKALNGDLKAAEWLFDRGYGKAKQFIEQSGSLEIRNVREMSDDELTSIAAGG